jgi:NTE family protein
VFVGATRVRTGTLRLFENRELTSDSLLASACLPTLNHAIEIDGEPYWDGGYTETRRLSAHLSLQDAEHFGGDAAATDPRGSADQRTGIRSRLTEFQFNSSFLREMRSIALAKQAIDAQWLPIGSLERRYRKLNFHLIETDDLLARMSIEKTLNADLGFLLKLKEEGRTRAGAWLNISNVGQSSIDLAKLFG